MVTLDDLESRLRTLFEEKLMKLFPGQKAEDQLALKLATAMQVGIKEGPEGVSLAPDVYVLVAHPTVLSLWTKNARLLKELGKALQTVGLEAGLHFNTHPTITTTADTAMSPDEMRILASFTSESSGETAGMTAKPEEEGSNEAIPGSAFLILHGTKIIPLTLSVINIGRRLDNHIVIDDPRVSRNHAQLRAIKGRFVVFDLNSTGGTFVNGQPANQSVLYPGDVISLAGVTLIFGQDLPTASRSRELDHTAPGVSASADRPTAVLKAPPTEDKPE
jgi:hypothetical protein